VNRFLSKTRWLTHYVLPTIILVGSAVAFYAMGSTPEVPRKPRAAAKATVVEVAEVQSLDGPLSIETTGEVVPHRVLSLASEVQGRIVFKHPNLRVGEQVEAGETLIKIDPQRFALAVQRLEITVNQAATTLKQLQQDQANLTAQISLARNQFDDMFEGRHIPAK
jgi:multidrug efflux pump subunit AcrA (membrane-fusion protein)